MLLLASVTNVMELVVYDGKKKLNMLVFLDIVKCRRGVVYYDDLIVRPDGRCRLRIPTTPYVKQIMAKSG